MSLCFDWLLKVVLMHRQLLTVLLFLGLSVPAQSAVVNSPGAIASIEAPPGLTFANPAEMDLLQFVEEGRTQILVSVLRPGEPKALLALLLQSLGADYGGVSGYSQSSVFLGAQGQVVYGGYFSFSGPGSSVLGSGGKPQGAWQVRGNRLIVFSSPSDFLNARFQVFGNGIEVYPAGRKTLLWVRQ